MTQYTNNITQERAARRFEQIAVLEHQLVEVIARIAQGRSQVKELVRARDGVLMRLRQAARDEGELPLFSNLDGE